MSSPHESVRGIDPWCYEVNLLDVDPVFRSSCCGNSYCRKWSKIVMVILNCIPIWLRCEVVSSMIRKGLDKYDTYQFVVFK